jgi:peptidoglycan/LPS O-acetylase OafA/YrhL
MERTQISRPRPHLPALTGLRFLAAMHVVLFHTALPHLAGAPSWLRGLVGSGYVGVSLFFVLSGFILAYNYLDARTERAPAARPFWAARLARVYPVYLLGLLVSLPYFVRDMAGRTGDAWSWFATSAAAAPALLQAWLPRPALLWNGPGWSLSAEAFFYLVFPLLAVPVLRMRRRGLLVLLAAAWALTFVAPSAYLYANPDRLGWAGHEYMTTWLGALKFNPLVRLPEFVMGVVLGRLYVLGPASRAEEEPGRARLWLAPAVAAGIVAVLCLSPRFPYVYLHNGLLAPAFAALVWLLASGRGMGRLLAGRRMGLLGEASYALYILHLPFASVFHSATKALGIAGSTGWHLAAYLALAVALSVLVLRRVEEPARRALRRRLSGRPASATAVEGAVPVAA